MVSTVGSKDWRVPCNEGADVVRLSEDQHRGLRELMIPELGVFHANLESVIPWPVGIIRGCLARFESHLMFRSQHPSCTRKVFATETSLRLVQQQPIELRVPGMKTSNELLVGVNDAQVDDVQIDRGCPENIIAIQPDEQIWRAWNLDGANRSVSGHDLTLDTDSFINSLTIWPPN